MNREQLAAEHPALLESILAEGRTAGASAERSRILAIESAAIPGHDALVAQLKADGNTSAGDAALQILAAEKQTQVKAGAAYLAEAPAALRVVAAATVQPSAAEQADAEADANSSLSIEDQCKATWDKTPGLRAEFSSLDSYTSYMRATASGHARIFKAGK